MSIKKKGVQPEGEIVKTAENAQKLKEFKETVKEIVKKEKKK